MLKYGALTLKIIYNNNGFFTELPLPLKSHANQAPDRIGHNKTGIRDPWFSHIADKSDM